MSILTYTGTGAGIAAFGTMTAVIDLILAYRPFDSMVFENFHPIIT
jgi:hypothetical protein